MRFPHPEDENIASLELSIDRSVYEQVDQILNTYGVREDVEYSCSVPLYIVDKAQDVMEDVLNSHYSTLGEHDYAEGLLSPQDAIESVQDGTVLNVKISHETEDDYQRNTVRIPLTVKVDNAEENVEALDRLESAVLNHTPYTIPEYRILGTTRNRDSAQEAIEAWESNNMGVVATIDAGLEHPVKSGYLPKNWQYGAMFGIEMSTENLSVADEAENEYINEKTDGIEKYDEDGELRLEWVDTFQDASREWSNLDTDFEEDPGRLTDEERRVYDELMGAFESM